MAREQKQAGLTFVNISKGEFVFKNAKGEKENFGRLRGTIRKVEFEPDEYQGKKFEVAKFTIQDGEENNLLKMRTDSGYFRGLCNSLRSGNPTEEIRITPNYKVEGDKQSTTIFVEQNGKTLKWFYTKDHKGDGEYPELKKVKYKGNEEWDGTEQVEFWKSWLSGQKWKSEFEAPAATFETVTHEKQAEYAKTEESAPPIDDLPF